MQHTSTVGVGFIPTLADEGYLHQFLLVVGRTGINPTLAAAGYLHQFLLVVSRTGINPVPTAAKCNTLAINGLSKQLQHTSNAS